MRWLQLALLSTVLASIFGCGSDVPEPPTMTEDVKSVIAEEDARVAEEESQQAQ